MRTVGIVTDSTSDITPDAGRELDVRVVPLIVAIGDETFADGDLTQEEFFLREMGSARRGKFAIMHALSPEKAEWLEARVREAFDVVELRVIKAGAVITAHTGTGWGVAVLPIDA